VAAGGRLKDRFIAISGTNIENDVDESAWGSYEQRQYLMIKSLKGIEHYPQGIGLGNFTVYSGVWREVHVSYLQIAVEGGIGSLVLYLLFFGRGFGNLRRLRRTPGLDRDMELFSGALYATLIGFIVGALFAPEAYQYFPYFAVAYSSVMLAIVKEKDQPQILPPDSLKPARWSRLHARADELAAVRGGGVQQSGTLRPVLGNPR
jgi:hypothetical protein